MNKIINFIIIGCIHYQVYGQDELGSILDAVEFKRSAAPLDVTSGLNGESRASELKIAFIDMNRLFTSFHETKTAEDQLNRARAEAKAELDKKIARLQERMDEINSQNSRGRANDRLVQEARDYDKQVADFRANREKVLQQEFVEMRKDIIEKITLVVRRVADQHGVNVIYDRSGMSMGQVPVVFYTKGVFDITDVCIELANSQQDE